LKISENNENQAFIEKIQLIQNIQRKEEQLKEMTEENKQLAEKL